MARRARMMATRARMKSSTKDMITTYGEEDEDKDGEDEDDQNGEKGK